MKTIKILMSLGFALGVVALMPVNSHAVPVTLDLSLVTSSGTINNAIFSRTFLHGQGSGVLDPFVRIQEKDSEKGYNTDGTLEFDTKGGSHTHSIKIGDIPLVNIDGTDYREFLLDAGEDSKEGETTLNLDVLKLFLLSGPSISGYPANFPNVDLKYEMVDADFDSILLDNITGNGTADMYAYIPADNFTGSNQYLYLYSEFNNSSGTFEEWGPGDSTDGGHNEPTVPEPATLALFASGLSALALRRKQK